MATPIRLPASWGEAWLREPGDHCREHGTARSYDHTGRQLVWRPPAGALRAACDIEVCSRFDAQTARALGLDPADACCRWVATEVLAKLADTPVLAWIKGHGFAPVVAPADEPWQLLVVQLADDHAVVAFGWHADQGPVWD